MKLKKKLANLCCTLDFSVTYKLESIALCSSNQNRIYTIRCEESDDISYWKLTAKEILSNVEMLMQLPKPIVSHLTIEAQESKHA